MVAKMTKSKMPKFGKSMPMKAPKAAKAMKAFEKSPADMMADKKMMKAKK